MTLRPALFSQPAPIAGRVNEDVGYCAFDDETVVMLVADGAGQRLKTTLTHDLFDGQSAARYAARLVRDTVAYSGLQCDPVEVLLNANDRLYECLCQVYGDLTAEAMLHHEPQLAEELMADERLIRLALPICVTTLVRVDLYSSRLWFAHAGDTALFLFHEDGTVTQVTDDHVAREHDNQALYTARTIQQEHNLERLSDVLNHPNVQRANRKSGLYHNYVDSHGQTNASLGVAVVNGLPELGDYLQRGEVSIDGVRALLVCSDGFIWRERWGESESETEQRWQMMRQRIESDGLAGYVAALRAIEQVDSACNLYPRFKVHDDVTAVYLEI